jgi:uncharacterized membrane protein YbaN (DUF454 family)
MVSTSPQPAGTTPGGRIRRSLWFATGWVAVAIGSIGIVVPGLPTTVFFIVAASCFAKSSPRFERWVLELPRVGPLVRDYRAGLGMPRRAKVWAIAIMLVVAGVSVFLSFDRLWFAAVVVALILVGIWVIVFRVPTRERMLELRGQASPSS